MDKTTPAPVEIPTALPGFEDDDAREKLLLEAPAQDPKGETDEEDIARGSEPLKPKTRRLRVVRTFVAFAVFVCILAVSVSWFFGMGWFSEQKAQPISRSSTSKDGLTSPATEDEKMKMALSMVAAPDYAKAADAGHPPVIGEAPHNKETPDLQVGDALHPAPGVDNGQRKLASGGESYRLPSPKENSTDKTPSDNSKPVVVGSSPNATTSDDARGRSLFFGVTRKPAKEVEKSKWADTEIMTTTSQKEAAPTQIPFGTLLPVRLVGSIYTLRNSGGFVRMELTRPVEGKGYFYPAGTLVLGNVRSGESIRAFVTILGLLDPVSGELVKFSGELLGRDGASGIEGKRRNLTSQWTRFFRGMKDTAASVLGSIGAIRSGSTVILSEPIRRGTESMSEGLSGALLKNDREETFLEVAAGSNGYVLVTGLPENAAAVVKKPTPEAENE